MLLRGSLASLLLLLLACSGETAKDATSAVVGKAIEVGKGTATGIAAGVEQGRKDAESADGAVIVSSHAELAKIGKASLGDVTASGDHSEITVLFANDGDRPARITKVDTLALDGSGVVLDVVTHGPSEVTVPAKAKAKYAFVVNAKPDAVKAVRVYGQDVAK